jgi:hypothetical protein
VTGCQAGRFSFGITSRLRSPTHWARDGVRDRLRQTVEYAHACKR